jgi:hypothetical protein
MAPSSLTRRARAMMQVIYNSDHYYLVEYSTWLSTRHLNTLLSLRTAAMIRGGLKDTCETQETVAAP